jgi:hypothetical protein
MIPMRAKLNAKWGLLIMAFAFAAAGSWMLAGNCHRIDLGAPDDNVVAAAPACDARATLYGWDRPSVMIVDEGFQVASDDAGPPAPQSGCAEQ